ncbi:zeaxanthin epoxidase, putative [Talaromyces stipitatus ATCC 10500]|uniref:Zeaxanthin epoxidase, putative n=1 Tax=Talaromyces stipitatus (strain ATCC 10500 / CBS 375.48 / QM 6759 / NRRL 1006) TaxID=441959 RepID=B8MLU8_TALSN|nr:zeaxanthin epoxidase, putative [Talaromyces stipitatus ATCC 10500]EED13874.1 zeaxanthin epoxidase, putative [Talaromyces stipitatus ATCC 10500]
MTTTTTDPTKTKDNMDPPFHISIIGGGIIGLNLALGLLNRNISVTIYEQAHEIKEIGAGIGISFGIQECMRELDPRIPEMLPRIAVLGPDTLQWVDASSTTEDFGLRGEGKLFDMRLPMGEGFYLCHRAELCNELVKLLPEGCLRLGKRLDGFEQGSENAKVVMSFTDGTKVEADAVIGCDGIKSRVRNLLLGDENPASKPHYAKESAYRSLISMSKASSILGSYSSVLTLWIGHGASIVTFPLSNNKYLNVAAFVQDNNKDGWPDYHKHTVQASKAEIMHAFADFNPRIRRLFEELPDEQNRWGIFDTLDYPLESYAYGCVAVAGDAAHGSTPHHGMGAGMGIEDALVLRTVLERAKQKLSADPAATSKKIALSRAFETFDSIRRERSQWLVASSRRQGQLVKWGVPEIRNKEDFVRDTQERISKLYGYDWRLMVKQSIEDYEKRTERKDR